MGPRHLVLPVVIGVLLLSLYVMLFADVDREMRGIAGLGIMFTTMMLGVPVAIAMALGGGLGLLALVGGPAVVSAYKDLPFRSAANWHYSALPMFVLMGVVLWRADVTEKMFAASRAWLNWLPGSLAVATNFAGAGLAAASGSTLGISFALGRIAVPEMIKAGYDRGLAAGVVIMAGTLGQLIPPSILLVIYAGVTQVPMGPLLLSAIVPGLMTALAYGFIISGRAALFPGIAPRSDEIVTWNERWRSLLHVWPVPLIILIIVGGLFSGVFTATEAGAYAAGVAIAIAFLYSRKRAFKQVGHALIDTVSVVGSILLLIMGVALLNRFFALSGLPFAMVGFIDDLGLGRVEFLLLVMVLYLVMGMFMDPLAIMLLTIPVLMPTLAALDIDLIWYGVFAVMVGELAIVTPPVGILTFLIHKLINTKEVRGGSRPIGLGEVFAGVSWFVVVQLLIVILLIFYPQIVELPPNLSRAG